MVTNRKEHTQKTPGKQAPDVVIPKPIKIGAATPYDFQGSNLTAYGGLLPVATMLEKLQFRELIEQHVTIKRLTPRPSAAPARRHPRLAARSMSRTGIPRPVASIASARTART